MAAETARPIRIRRNSGGVTRSAQTTALGRRITLLSNYSGETPGHTRHFYHDGLRVIEERENSETTAERQFVWGTRYVDELILRDRDEDSNLETGDRCKADSGLEERILAMQDANFNMVPCKETLPRRRV